MFFNQPANLITYLPSYYEDNEEIIRLTDTENPEIDDLWASVKETTDNQFVRTSGDKRIRQWERLLRMRPDYAAQTLDYRKDVVIMRLSTRIPLTYRWLDALLYDLAGAGHYAIDLRHNEYFILIHLMERPDIGEDLWFHLRRSLPANLGLGFKYTVTNRVTSPYITGLTAADSGKIFIPHPKVINVRVKDRLYGVTQPTTDIRRETVPPKLPGDVKINGALTAGALPVTDRRRDAIPPMLPKDIAITGTATAGAGLTVDSLRLRVPHRKPQNIFTRGLEYTGSGGLVLARVRIPTNKVQACSRVHVSAKGTFR